jgi:hypothetical protein
MIFRLLRGEGGIDVGEKLKNLIEASDLEVVLDAFLNTSKRKLAAIFLNALHSFDEKGENGAVEKSHISKIDNEDLRLFCDHGTQRFGDLRRKVEVDLSFKL